MPEQADKNIVMKPIPHDEIDFAELARVLLRLLDEIDQGEATEARDDRSEHRQSDEPGR